MRASHAGLAAMAVALGACAADRGDAVTNASAVWSVASEPQVAIGRLEGDPHYLFQSVAGARLFSEGRVVVADRGTGTVKIFGPDGSFEREMGRAGEGPGEFLFISSLSVHPPDTIAVYDGGLYRLTHYSSDGALLSTVRLEGEGGGAPEIFLGRFENGDFALASIVPMDRDPAKPTPDAMRFDRFAPDGDFASIAGTASGMVRYGGGPIPFSPYLHSFVYRDSIYFTDGVAELTVLGDEGGVARTFGLPRADVDYERERARLKDRLEVLERVDAAERLGDVPVPPSIPDAAEALLDDEGHFWLKRYQPDTDSNWLTLFDGRSGGEWSILDLDGQVVATIRLPSRFTPMDVRQGRLVGVMRDELDVQRVLVFQIVREGR